MQRLLASWLEAALHPVLDRYFEDLSREQLRLSIFAGDVVLNGLVLRPEAIRAASLPVHVQRGSVRELRIRVPWLHLQTEPIEIIIDTIEIVVALQHDLSHGAPPPMRPHTATASTADSPAPAHAGGGGDSWVQSLVQRALLNAALRVRNAVVKLVDGRAVASLSLRSLTLDSADGRWDRCFVELEGASRTLRKVLELSDLTLCLDALGAGSSRVKRFERPLLRAPLLTLRAEAPLLPGARTDGSPTLRLDALSHRLDVSVSEAQLGLLDGLVQAVQAAIEEAKRVAVCVRTERSQQRSHRAATDTTALAPNAADTMAAASVGPARSAAIAVEGACASASCVPTGSQGVSTGSQGEPTGSQGVSQGHTAAATAAPAVVEVAREGAQQHSQQHSQQNSPPRSPPRSRLGRAAGWAYSMFFEDDEDEGEPEGPAAASHGGGSQGPAAASVGSHGVGSMTGAAAASGEASDEEVDLAARSSGEASDEEVDLAARSSIWDLELSAHHVCVMTRLSSASLTLLSAPPDATAHDSARPIAALLLLGTQLEGHCVEDEPGARCGAQCARCGAQCARDDAQCARCGAPCARDDAPCVRDDAPAADLSFVVRVASLSIWRSLDDSSHDSAKGLASGPLLTMLSHAGGAPPQVG
jgi:hypothetical protein